MRYCWTHAKERAYAMTYCQGLQASLTRLKAALDQDEADLTDAAQATDAILEQLVDLRDMIGLRTEG